MYTARVDMLSLSLLAMHSVPYVVKFICGVLRNNSGTVNIRLALHCNDIYLPV